MSSNPSSGSSLFCSGYYLCTMELKSSSEKCLENLSRRFNFLLLRKSSAKQNFVICRLGDNSLLSSKVTAIIIYTRVNI